MAENDTKANPGGAADIPKEPVPPVGEPEKDKISGMSPTVGAKTKDDSAPVGENTPKEIETVKPGTAAEMDKAADPKAAQGKPGKSVIPPKSDKGDKGRKADPPKEKKTRAARPPDGGNRGKVINISGAGVADDKTPPKEPEPPKDATRPGKAEEIVYISLADLHPFNTYRAHPFSMREDAAMQDTMESVKRHGVQQPAIVRPREGGGFEIIAGHRRHKASEIAGYINMPCIVRDMNDYDAVQYMKETNKQRDAMLPSELAKLLDLELEAIKHQGTQLKGVAKGDVGKRSVEIAADNNNMKYKTVQRYVALNRLVPELMDLVDVGKVKPTTVGYQMSFLKPKSQQYIAMSIEAETPVPTEDKVKRMRELEDKKLLDSNVIDGIMMEENKREDRKVVLTSQDLDKYFGLEKTPSEMKATILKALDDYKTRQPLEFGKTEKPKETER